jgi:SAM-dependent methyltransferase
MYKVARRRNRKNTKIGIVNLYNDDFETWDDLGRKYDFIYLVNVIYFWEELEVKIKKIYKILEKNGTALIAMASPELLEKNEVSRTTIFNKHEVETVINIMRNNGFWSINKQQDKKVDGFYYIFGKK